MYSFIIISDRTSFKLNILEFIKYCIFSRKLVHFDSKLLSHVVMYRVVEGPVFCALALEFNEENVRSLKEVLRTLYAYCARVNQS